MTDFVSLCTGIGGIDLGLEAVGLRCVAQVEIDADLRRYVLDRWWPDVPKFGDIRDVGAHNLPRADLICAGFPCQPISLAGRRRGRADPRWLWPEVARVVRELRPRYVFVENVSALLRPYQCPERCGGYLPALAEDVLADLAALGYDAEWASIRASDVDAPHERDRVWIIAQLADTDGLRRVHGEAQERSAEAGVDALGDAASGGRNGLADPNDAGRRQQRVWIIAQLADTDGLRRGRSQSGLGGDPHGLPDRMDGWPGWPARPGEAQYEYEPPRLTTAKGRTKRLHALGNAVVPQVVEMIGRWIVEAEARKVGDA